MIEQKKGQMAKVFGFALITTCVLPASTEYLKLDGSNAMTGPLVVNSTATIAGNSFSVGGSAFVVEEGKIGIGMLPEHPDLRMEVLGIIKSSGPANSLMFSDRGNSAHSYEWYSSGDIARLYSNVSGRDIIAFTPEGRVGIGTASPTKKLQIHSANADTHLKISGTGPGIFLSDAEGTPTSSFGVYSMSTSAGQYGSLNSGDLIIAANHDVYITANYQAGGKNLILQPLSGPSSAGGKVGIGTASPAYLFDIYGVSPLLRINGNGTGSEFLLSKSGTPHFLFAVDGVDSYIDYAGSNGRVLFRSGIGGTWKVIFGAGGEITSASLAGTGNRAVYSDPTGTLTNSSSDARLKKRVTSLTPSSELKQVLKLRPVSFYWNTSLKRAANLGRQEEIGLVAQEVASVVPQVVGENADGYKTVDYAKLVPVLIGAIQSQQEYIKALEKRIDALENRPSK